MIKTLIADDEKHARDRIKDLLAEHDNFKVVAEAKDGTSALESIVSHEPEVAFLDINMPGISVFKSVTSLSNPPLVVFQTAHSKYAADAFEIDALDYLLKPVSRERFDRAISKILDKLSQGDETREPEEVQEKDPAEKITVKDKGVIKIIPVEKILKICFEEGLTFIHTHEGRFISDKTLNHYESKFENFGFFRSNRANLINLDFVASIHKDFKGNFLVEMKDSSQVELSRRKAQQLKKILDF